MARADAIQEASGVDLIGDEASNELVGLLFDQRKLAAVLWQFCKGQADEQGITKDAFLDELDSDALSAGWEAVTEAVTFFTPSHRRRAFEVAFERQMQAIESGTKAIEQVIESQATTDGIQRTIDQMTSQAQAEIEKALAGSASS